MNDRPGGNARLMALDLLSAVLDDHRNLGETEPLEGATRDRAHAMHLAYGVLRGYSALDWLAGRLMRKPLRARDRDIHRLVLIGLFQLWRDGTPPHAAINATAECARQRGKAWAVGLVNAVLRRFQRERVQLEQQLAGRDEWFAHPDWLLGALRDDWPQDWPAIVDANNRQAPLWLRLNRRREPAATLDLLRGEGLETARHPYAADAVRVEPARPATALPGFGEGRLSVQDPAAQLAADLLDARDGQRVLDACAAPGGKTGHLLESHDGLQLIALDRSATRLARVRENLERLGLAAGAGLVAADAADPGGWWDGQPFDRILLDAPCSATGVIRRHPEIKWLRSLAQVDEAVAQQRRLLEALWPLLAPGGMLLYATCSVLRAENERLVGAFLRSRVDAGREAIDGEWGRESGGGRQILPGEQEMDGFFYARLRKTS
ncbi:MAG: 16S rRNA (cytosine(967)-C(5))-methyltransferase RsmB [Gammaproteobacteria bacterium]